MILSDEYSKYSCSRCLHDLKTFHLIRKKFLETQIFLDDCAADEKNENVGEIEEQYPSYEILETQDIQTKEEGQSALQECIEYEGNLLEIRMKVQESS